MKSGTSSPGEDLAKVLLHYGLIESVYSTKQKIICPFHGDMNPSMSVNLEDGFFYCFGCGAKGDSQDFVKKMEVEVNGKNDLEAARIYFRIVNDKEEATKIVIHKQSPEAIRSSQRHLYDVAYDLYHGLKKVSWMSSDEPEVKSIRKYMHARGFMPSTLQEVGCKPTYRKNYPMIFPVMDNGKFKGWVCRTTIPEVEAKRKYLYNKGFRRALTLVGNYGVFNDKLLDSFVFVVEGYMDRLKFIQFGVKNVVAIFGWKMSEIQEKKLKDCGIMTIVSALDNDECGRKGTKYLRSRFEVVRFKYLKGIKDPGDMDAMSFRRMYEKTMQEVHRKLGE